MDHRRVSHSHGRGPIVACGCVLALAIALSPTSASSQETGETGEPGAEPSEPGSTTTTTTSPPVTVVLDDGDYGVVPPGAGDPEEPQPEPGAGPDGAPDGGELEVPEELPVIVLPDPTPGLNAALAALDVTQHRDSLAAADRLRQEAARTEAAAFSARAEAVDRRRAAGERAHAAKQLVDALAVQAVMFGDFAGDEPLTGPIDGPPTLDELRDLELRDVVVDVTLERLDAAKTAYADAVEEELMATAALARVRAQARAIESMHLEARSALDAAMVRASEARRQVGPTILGPTVLKPADLVAWYRTFYPADPPMASIESLIEAYVTIGGEEGVTGDIAFAQAILETGGFRSGHARAFNFAGIGAYDACAPTCGFTFPSLEAGVRAHIQLLRAYADPTLTTAELASPPDPRLTPEDVGVRGCCERWTALTGVWATDPNYDRKVLGIYRLMVEAARALDRQQL